MEYMLIMLTNRDDPPTPPEVASAGFQKMGQWAGSLAGRGKLRGGAPLKGEAEGVRIRRGSVYDGPFAEAKEVIGGYFLVEAASMDEARELARTCPHADIGIVEVREIVKMGPP